MPNLLCSLALALCAAAAAALPTFNISADVVDAMRAGRALSNPNIYNGVNAGADIVARTVRITTCYAPGFNDCTSCTGAVIRRRWFLTAAHCVLKDSGARSQYQRVRLGTKDYITRMVHVYSSYSPDPLSHDIALVQIRGRFDGDFVDIAYRLPTKPAHVPAPGKLLRIAGFGLTGPSSGISEVLQESSIPRIGDGRCFTYPSRGFICTSSGQGAGDSDVVQCSGDSGGPLFVGLKPDKNGNARFRLTGINSATVGVGSDGFFCGSNNNLHIHAKVLDYMTEITACLKKDCSAFTSWVLKRSYYS